MKIFTTLFNKLFFLLTLLTFGVGNAWGYTWTAKVGVSQGKGSVKIQIYNNAKAIWGGKKVVAESGVATNTTLKNCTTTVSAPTTYGWPICVVESESTGYTFAGWYDADGNQKSTSWTYETNSETLLSAGWSGTWTKTYYAKFTANSYDVTLNPNGGSGSNQTISATYDAAMPSKLKNNNSIVKPSRNGYTFAGYYDAQSGGTKYYNADLSSAKKWDKAPTSATTLYARWQENTYTITWPTIESGLVYTPGEIVQNHFATAGSAVDGTTTVAGTFTCSDELQPAKNSTGYTVTFTPSNSTKYLSKTKTIKQDVAKADQYITWGLLDGLNPKGKYYEYAEGEPFNATSYRAESTTPTGLTITYTSSDNSIATVDGNVLKVHKVGEVVTITASCVDAAGNWNDATSTISKTFKTCGVKPNTFNVSASNLTYGQFLSASTLSGTVSVNGGSAISGTLSWVEPETFPSAGANQTFEALFTPTNLEAFGAVTFNVTVNVAKANPELTWNIGNNLRAESHYNNFVSTNNAEAGFTITTSNSSLLSVDGTKLTTGSVDGATEGWVRVSLPATANFNALSAQQLNVTVNPKSNVCLPITTMDSEMYDRTFVSGTDDAKWSDEGLLGIGVKYFVLYTVFYTRRSGIQLGDWNEGFTGADFDAGKYSDKSVVLTFNGAPQNISFDVETQYVYVTKSSGIGIGLTFPYPATYTNWYLYESADGSNFTQVGEKFNSSSTEAETSTHISRALKPETRYVKIVYSGNFAGWVKNLQISKRSPYLNANQSSLTFGTNEHPLQDPQAVTISYGALGTCGQTGAITASIEGAGSSAFYLDETSITDNVGFDYNGEYTVRVRCNDVNKSATIRFRAFDGTEKTVALSSAKPELTSAGSSIFKTGTEHAAVAASAYRANTAIDYTKCFNDATALFDTLYIYGVSESSAANRLWDMDGVHAYKVPAINVAAGNIYTPCFVYAKNNNKYVYARTCDATKTLNIAAAGKKLGFIGYRPANMATTANAIQLNGAAGEQTELYLSNVEIVANGVAIRANSSSDTESFALTLNARGTNILSANASAIQLSAKSSLTIEDSWKSEVSAVLALRSAAGYPSIDLGGNNRVNINGTQLELHNATKMAIAHMDGATELTDGEVRINDGTILGATTLGMPQNTLIDGGTFNDGNIVCYTANAKTVRPFNSRGEILSRQEKLYTELPDWYGKAHLSLVGANVYPMLFGAGEGLCIFEGTQDQNSGKVINWTSQPESSSDAIISSNMEVIGTLTVNSLTIDEGVTVTVTDGATLNVGDGDSFRNVAGNIHVENNGKVVLSTNGSMVVNDFILDAALGNDNTAGKSGQVKNFAQMNVRGNAYFQMDFDPAGKISYGWYDFTVPFAVNINGGISRVNSANDKVMVSGKDFIIMEADEQNRANGGKGWRTLNSGTLQPGKLYTITLDDEVNQNTLRFTWNGTGSLSNGKTYAAKYATGSATDKSGWNGIGNGMLRHGHLENNYKMQAYNHASNTYELVTGNKTFAVGSAFFIQVNAAGDVEWEAAEATTERPLYAPQREIQEVEEFRMSLRKEDTDKTIDVLYFSASEEATEAYVIGHDLLKMGTLAEAKVARMWATKGGKQLCDIETTLLNENASAPLSFFTPQAGEYILSVEEAPKNANLYLTYNENIIWDLTTSPYTLELGKGATEGYGLRMEVVNAPQIATGVDDVQGDNVQSTKARKVLIDNRVYLITPEGAIYDIIGKSIR